jgi:thioredoxin-related protein
MLELSLSRRHFLAGCAALAAMPGALPARAAELSDDGLYVQPWFLQSFLDLREDLHGAQTSGKPLIVLWEMKGCPYCKLLHTVNFANPKIADYAKANFDVLQLNFLGARPVTNFDGKALPEKDLSVVYGIEGTPTLQFFHEREGGEAEEIGRVQYLKPEAFFGMLRFVHEKGYEDMPFDEWIQAHPAKV